VRTNFFLANFTFFDNQVFGLMHEILSKDTTLPADHRKMADFVRRELPTLVGIDAKVRLPVIKRPHPFPHARMHTHTHTLTHLHTQTLITHTL
jgi:hypothetical protein